ncbi:c-type cytochrome biogenesis protein CcsB [Ornithinicoccus hortensis]|uniref:Cytochrome c-type biogenesis protein CcsB n=1 Tax=Ornithinicoccus hortensis TaxID=82346 RepID=A0A542YVS0_9MICO|nr:c-type cytochrome biogenesis protein CcsB [Ornithinicoccus hortensis]TQL52186.1 cytochrome c-type biogenesis protein CcsB [Ornithinicoccus hortensis]
MTSEQMADTANMALYVALPVLTLAMLAFAMHLAVQTRGHGVSQQRELALAGAADASLGAAGGTDAADEPPAGPQVAEPPSRRWGVIGLQLTWLATFALIVSIGLRGLAVSRPPVGNMFEFALMAVAFLLVLYSLWSLRSERLWLGVFVTGLSLLILGVAVANWYTPAGALLPSLNSKLWLIVHVTVATLTIGLLAIGFLTALLFLVKEQSERTGRPAWRWLGALPTPRKLEQMTYGIHVVGFPLWTFTVIAGAIWAEHAWGRYWGWDAKEVWSFVIWVVYAAYLHAHATTGWTARRATWVAVAGFTCIILNYTVVNTFFVGLHSYSGL